MPRCSVCQTHYTNGKSESCPICGWDLQPYSLITGLIPEVSAKEKKRLEWAQALWLKIQPQQEQITQLKQQLDTMTQTAAALRAQLHQVNQEQHRLKQLLQERETAESQLQHQLEQAEADVSDLQVQLDQMVLRLQDKPDTSPDPTSDFSRECSKPSQETDPADEAMPESRPGDSVLAAMPWQPSPSSVLPIAPLSSTLISIQNVRLNERGELLQVVQQTLPCYSETVAGTKFELMAIPAGSFWMGSPQTELERDTHESPCRRVMIAPFLMARLLVTQAQWRAIAQFEMIQRPLDPDPSHFKGDNLPVERVCWHDAIEFCARLSRATGRFYRLPSEAEWEYACRAGTETPFHLGETLNAEFVNYDGNDVYREGAPGLYRQVTTPVGTLAVNGFGLADMHGNVWEWCEDPWHDDYQDAPSDGSVWRQGGIENHRVLRGGAWYCLPELCRSAQRHWDEVNHSGSGIGFRIACSLM